MLNPTYNPQIFNALGEIEKVDKQLKGHQIKPLGDIIVKHGYENVVSVIKAHRHFDLNDWEAMLETQKADTVSSVTSPVALETIKNMGGEPNMLSLSGEGEWFAVNYGLGVNSLAWKNEKFLQEVANYLLTKNLAGLLMLGVCARGQSKGMKFLERNFDDCRTSESKPIVDLEIVDATAIATTFQFVRDGSMIACQQCSFCTPPQGGVIHKNETHKSQTE